MIVATNLVRRCWVGIAFIFSIFRLPSAQGTVTPAGSTAKSTKTPMIKEGRVFRLTLPYTGNRKGSFHYGLEATGSFPFVRLIALPEHSAPVPLEVAPVPAISKSANSTLTRSASAQERHPVKKSSRGVQRRLQANEDKPFCFPANCQSCLSCPTCCIVCNSCSSSAGCSSCGTSCSCS